MAHRTETLERRATATTTRRDRPRPNVSSLPLMTSGVMLLLMGGLFLAYLYAEPMLYATPDPEPRVSAQLREYSMPDAFAIQIRNQVLGGPHAVPERA